MTRGLETMTRNHRFALVGTAILGVAVVVTWTFVRCDGSRKSPQSEKVQTPGQKRKDELRLGDTDLKEGLRRAVASFEPERSRQRVLVFIGDGMSTHSRMTETDRARVCQEMVKSEIAFFPIPL